jgi:hypothetical protein
VFLLDIAVFGLFILIVWTFNVFDVSSHFWTPITHILLLYRTYTSILWKNEECKEQTINSEHLYLQYRMWQLSYI